MPEYVYIYRGGSKDGELAEQDVPLPESEEAVSATPGYVLVRDPDDEEQYMLGGEVEVLGDGRLAHVLRLWLLD